MPRSSVLRPSGARARVAATLGALLLAVTAACGPDTPPEPAAPYTAADGSYHVPVLMADMRFEPSTIVVPEGTHLVVDLENTDGMPHDLVLPDGATSGLLSRGQKAAVDVGTVTEALEGWCSVQGHRAAGMVLGISVG